MKKKKLTWMLALITALMTTACSNDENMPGSGGNDNGVITFTVTPDYGVKTRAGLDALPADKALRCIMEVYNTSGAFVSRKVKYITTISVPIEFTVEKKSENKTVVFWADFTTTGSPDADLYYKTDANSTYGLKAITFNPSNTTDFNGEAFYGNITLENGVAATTNVTLTHAVAMVSLKTTTQLKDLKSVKVTYGDTSGNTNAPASAFDASNGTCASSAATIIQINKIDATQTPSESAPYDFNTFYVFAPGTDKSLINMTMEMCFNDDGTIPMQTINVPNVPIRANYKTNITGDFAVQPNSFNITCEAEWATGELAPPAIWDGSIPAKNDSYAFGGGEGTETKPYLIADPKDLAQLAVNVNGGTDYADKYFELANDLDLDNNKWTPIGTNDKRFKGRFDGKSHSIKKLNINNDLMNTGLFGVTQGVIKNLHVSGSITNTNTTKGNNGGSYYSTRPGIGGIVGSAYLVTGMSANANSLLENCSFEGTVTAENGDVGGIAGKGIGIASRGCKNTGTISGGEFTGGIAGGIYESAYIDHCYNTGAINGKEYVGGITGKVYQADVRYCYNTGEFSGTNPNVGAIYGNLDSGYVTDCYYKAKYSISSEKEKEFSGTAWPAEVSWTLNTGGSIPNAYWKSLGSWNDGTPTYPTLWWE